MVRHYRFADAPPVRDNARRASALDAYDPYLRRRWAASCRNARRLWREIRKQGDAGTSRRVSRWARDRRTEPIPSTPQRHPDDADLRPLDRPRVACAPAAMAYPLLQEFVSLVRERAAARRDPWLDTAGACGVTEVETFAVCLRHERPEADQATGLPLRARHPQAAFHAGDLIRTSRSHGIGGRAGAILRRVQRVEVARSASDYICSASSTMRPSGPPM